MHVFFFFFLVHARVCVHRFGQWTEADQSVLVHPVVAECSGSGVVQLTDK